MRFDQDLLTHQKLLGDNLGHMYEPNKGGDSDLMYKQDDASRYESKPQDLDKNLVLNQPSSNMKPKIWSLADTAACKTPPLFNNNFNSDATNNSNLLLNNSGNTLTNQSLGSYSTPGGYGASR